MGAAVPNEGTRVAMMTAVRPDRSLLKLEN
jgi:hypothetical protein